MKKISPVLVCVILCIIAVVLSHTSAVSNILCDQKCIGRDVNVKPCVLEYSEATNTISNRDTVYLIGALIITIFVITAVVMILTAVVIIRRKTPISHAQIPMRTFRCPQCETKFKVKSKKIESKKRPVPVKCPNCGIKGVII